MDWEAIIIVPIVLIGFPWLLFHYMTRWKQAKTLTAGDEQLLDDLHDMARRLDDRLCTIERIMTAEDPAWRQTCLPESGAPLASDLGLSRLRSGEDA